jgi:hypothetical protein
VAIGMQKLVAESGYEYRTRQVAFVDPTGRGHSTLSDNYSAQGEVARSLVRRWPGRARPRPRR